MDDMDDLRWLPLLVESYSLLDKDRETKLKLERRIAKLRRLDAKLRRLDAKLRWLRVPKLLPIVFRARFFWSALRTRVKNRRSMCKSLMSKLKNNLIEVETEIDDGEIDFNLMGRSASKVDSLPVVNLRELEMAILLKDTHGFSGTLCWPENRVESLKSLIEIATSQGFTNVTCRDNQLVDPSLPPHSPSLLPSPQLPPSPAMSPPTIPRWLP